MKKIYGGKTVSLTSLDKKMVGTFTKKDLLAYYQMVAPQMLPFMKDHPLMMHRFPHGIEHEGFYQKDISDYFPEWIKRVEIEKKEGGSYTALLCQNVATLMYITNHGCITPHLWLARYDKLTHPDRLIFDLDPSDDDFNKIRNLALAIKELLNELGLKCYVMTSGSKGLHIYVPITRHIPFETAKEFTRNCAEIILKAHPDTATLALPKVQRDNKVFIDILRNQKGATAVCPYAIRSYDEGPIATPLYWEEVTKRTLSPRQFNLSNIEKRLQDSNPWFDYFEQRQTITKQMLKKVTT